MVTNWAPEPSLTISRSLPEPVNTLKLSFALLAEKSPLVSSIVVVCLAAPAPEAARMITESVLAAVASVPVGEMQLRKDSPPLP